MDSEELHGIFQFQFDDDIKAVEKQEFILDTTYRPKKATPAHFLTKPISISSAEKNGLKNVLMTIDYLYLNRNYTKCLHTCKEFFELNSNSNRPIKDGEVLEIAARCSLKLYDYNNALELCKKLHGMNAMEIGVLFFCGHVNRLNLKYNDTLLLFKSYLERRNNDYMVWSEISEMFVHAAELFQDSRSGLLALGRMCLKESLLSVKTSHRADTELSRNFDRRIIKKLEGRLEELEVFEKIGFDKASLNCLHLDVELVNWLLKKLSIE